LRSESLHESSVNSHTLSAGLLVAGPVGSVKFADLEMVSAIELIEGATSCSRKRPGHKPVFCNVQVVNIHEPIFRKTAIYSTTELTKVSSHCLLIVQKELEKN
jgi:hypothetical protein